MVAILLGFQMVLKKMAAILLKTIGKLNPIEKLNRGLPLEFRMRYIPAPTVLSMIDNC